MVADRDGENCRVGAYTYVITNLCRFPQIFIASGRASLCEGVVDKHDPVADEAVVSNGYEFAYEGMRLDFSTSPNFNILLNFDERADGYTIIDSAAIDIAWFDYGNIFAAININDSRLFYVGLIQSISLRGGSVWA